MGNGSSHGKDAKRYDHPPKGARVIGESGKVETYKGKEGTPSTAKKKKAKAVKKRS